jgi:uncharacterized heparinase superfamily protein
MLSDTRFRFLNTEAHLESAGHWNDGSIDKLWLYNLHYFDYLNAARDGNDHESLFRVIKRWIDENPPSNGIGWDPYPISLRIVNWIKYDLAHKRLLSEHYESLIVQTRYLFKKIEYHILANHLFANAKALVFAGLFFEDSESETWLRRGLSILAKEIPEQILSDGGNYERSPMYHSIMLEDMLDLINIATCYRHPAIDFNVINGWKAIAGKMLYWLKAMCHRDGRIALFNDAAFGISPEYQQLLQYAERLQVSFDPTTVDDLIHLNDTGYVAIHKPYFSLIIDAGDIGPDYQPGHGHADTHSFELSIGDNRVFVDSGTSCYGTGPERLRQRGTAEHNTIRVDGCNSSEVWSGFRVARRAKIFDRSVTKTDGTITIRSSHDGYRHIKVRTHTRTWIVEGNRIVINDELYGHGSHVIESFLHLHPGIVLIKESGNIKASGEFGSITICGDKEGTFTIEDSTYHPEFGLAIANKVLRRITNADLPCKLTTIIEIN